MSKHLNMCNYGGGDIMIVCALATGAYSVFCEMAVVVRDYNFAIL